MSVIRLAPRASLGETIRSALIPPALYYAFRAYRERHRGEREIALLPVLLDRARTSVDAGANKGVYTYWMQRYSRHVYAYEPNPRVRRVLEAGARGNVTVSPVALSNANGETMLRIPDYGRGLSNQGASLNYEKVGAVYAEVPVRTRRLDDEPVEDVGFMKIDVEGHEFAVLEGARGILARDRPTLLIEIEQAHNRQPIEDSLARVSAFGYTGFAVMRGTLSSLARFDPEAHHRAPASRADYIFNFLFFPTP